MVQLVAFDIGKKNFAFVIYSCDESSTCIEDFYKKGRVVFYKNIDLTYDCKQSRYLDPKLYNNMYTELDKYINYWNNCDIILIEQQMSFGRNRYNTMALKLGQHCYSYFVFKYMNSITPKKIIEFPAYHKTQVLNAPKKMTKPQRKNWSVEWAFHLLHMSDDHYFLHFFLEESKKDDIADCLLMCVAYILKMNS